MTDLSKTIQPKSDQMNADDLIAGPRTITITRLTSGSPDQPIHVYFEGDEGKPYKPCKSMRRVMARMWGPDGKTYTGRRMTLYRDDDVVFGGIKVGGIRISHMSGLERDETFPLTEKRASRKPYTVRALFDQQPGRGGRRAREDQPGGENEPGAPPTLKERIAKFKERCLAATTAVKLKAIWAAASGLRTDLMAHDQEAVEELDRWFAAREADLERAESASSEADDSFPGDR